jgi:hypothetical protein
MPPRMAFLLVAFCVALNAAGFLFHLFEPIPLYDELDECCQVHAHNSLMRP